jgi:hypothetical protein
MRGIGVEEGVEFLSLGDMIILHICHGLAVCCDLGQESPERLSGQLAMLCVLAPLLAGQC